MRVLIIEDEALAQDHLARLLQGLAPQAQVLAKLGSVADSADWLRQNEADLIFMDIHLADGSSFAIFEQVPALRTPVIFTTAYDQYAIRAFKVNSVDYLLKPIDPDDLRLSLQKYQHLREASAQLDVQRLVAAIGQGVPSYQERFLVQRGERILSVPTAQVAYFEGEDRYVYLTKPDGSRYIVDYRLGELQALLDPRQFFRLNRSFIARFEAIEAITHLSKSRVKVGLRPAARREIVVSSENVAAFKQWLNQ